MTPASPKARKQFRVLGLWLVFGLGAFLRMYAIGRESIWLDEAFSIWMASHPLATLLDWAVRIDQHPPLYYGLLRGWIVLFDAGPAAIRLLSALASIATLPLFYWLAERLTQDSRTAFVALILLAISPFHIQYAQESRMYALLTLLVTATIALVWLLWEQGVVEDNVVPGRRHTWRRYAIAGGLAICQAGAMLTHNVAAVFLPLFLNVAAFGLWRSGPRRFPLRLWLGSQMAAFLLWSPWFWPFVVQSQGVDRRFWLSSPTLDDLLDALRTVNFAFLPADFPLGGLWLFLLAGVALFGALRYRPAARLFLLTWLVLPVTGLLLVSIRQPLFHLPSLLWLSLPYYLCLAAGIYAPAGRPLIASTPKILRALLVSTRLWFLWLAMVVALNGVSLYTYYAYAHKEAWNEAAAFVAAEAEAGDLLLFNASWVQLPFDYYFDAEGAHVDRHGLPVDLFAGGELEPPMTIADLPRLRRLSAGYKRIWLIYSHDSYTDPQGLIPATLAQERNQRDVISFAGIRIYRFE